VLSAAMARYKDERRAEIEQRAKVQVKAEEESAEPLNERMTRAQVDILTKEDSDMAELYQDTMTELKLDKEADYQKLANIHNRFDYLYDKDAMKGKLKSEKYDLDKVQRDEEEQDISTELTDPNDNELYVRYKLSLRDNRDPEAEKKRLADLETSIRDMRKGVRRTILNKWQV